MKSKQRSWGLAAVLVFTVALALGPGFSGPAVAASEDVAMFYDDLSQYGQWVEVEKYGPVWRPNQVSEDWRPYTNGRWVPTNDGNVFESDEPWGWATYHYGNWMPTENNGWVWVPGRTWYPSTVEWRTSPETEPVDTSYIGWAPTPPPNYEPPPMYASPSYYQGAPVSDALASPLWIFARAASFLLGFGQPYNSGYSYLNSGFLVPPSYVPVFYSQTVFLPAYAAPNYYPPAFYGGRRHGAGYYNMGPSVTYISRVTNINQTIINRTVINNSNRITHIRNVMPPDRVLRRDGSIRNIMPPALVKGDRLPPPNPVKNVRLAQAGLNKPNIVPLPRNVPQIRGEIPRFQPDATPGRRPAVTALPARATMPLTPQMTQQIQKLPPQHRGGPAMVQPAATQPGRVQGLQPPSPGKPGPAQVTPGRGPGPAGVQAQPGTPPSGPQRRGEFQPGSRSGATPGGTPATPGAVKPGTVPLPQGHQGLTPEQRRQREVEHQRLQRGGTPGQPQQPQQQQPQMRERQQQQEQLRQQQVPQQQQQQQERSRQQQLQDKQGQERLRQQQNQQQQERQRQQQQQQQMRERQGQERLQQQQQQQRQQQQQERLKQQQNQQQQEGLRQQQQQQRQQQVQQQQQERLRQQQLQQRQQIQQQQQQQQRQQQIQQQQQQQRQQQQIQQQQRQQPQPQQQPQRQKEKKKPDQQQ